MGQSWGVCLKVLFHAPYCGKLGFGFGELLDVVKLNPVIKQRGGIQSYM